MEPLYSIRHLTLSFGNKVIFDDSNFQILSKDKIGLLGLNGKGKSSLFKIIKNELSPDTSTPQCIIDKKKNLTIDLVSQEIDERLLGCQDAKDFFFSINQDLKKLHRQYFENAKELESSPTSQDLLEKQDLTIEAIQSLKGWERLDRFLSYLKALHFTCFDQPVSILSGGQKRKLLIAFGLTSIADIVLWDEPTNHLDIETIQVLESEIQNSKQASVIVSHDRHLLGKVSNKIMRIENKKITTFPKGFEAFLEQRALDEQANLKTLKKLKNSFKREQEWMRQGVKARGTKSQDRIDRFHELEHKIKKIKEESFEKAKIELAHGQRKSKKLIQFNDVSFSYNQAQIFKGLNFTIYNNEKIGLIGENGSGKTTLCHLMTSRLLPASGEIKTLDNLSISYFTQDKKDLEQCSTPFELLGDGSDHVIVNDNSLHVATYLSKFLFSSEDLYRPIETMSGGEKARLQLAKNLTQKADIWIFDEPTNDLDLETIQVLEESLKEFKGTIILISHDRIFLENVTNKTFLIHENSLEKFEAGYEQASEYIEALKLQKELAQEEELTSESKPLNIAPTKKPNPQKVNTSHLQEQVHEKEELIEKIELLMQELGAHQHSHETIEKLSQLSQKKDTLEEELLNLYELLEQNT